MKTNTYTIRSRATGQTVKRVKATSCSHALDVYAQSCGFDDFNDFATKYPGDEGQDLLAIYTPESTTRE